MHAVRENQPSVSEISPVTGPVTGAIAVDEMISPQIPLVEGEYDPKTESLGNLARVAGVLPPPTEGLAGYSAVDDAVAVLDGYKPKNPEYRLLPPAVTPSDAYTMSYALQNEIVKEKLVEIYGDASYEAAAAKARAIVEVNDTRFMNAGVGVALKQYSRIRRGLPQSDDLPKIETARAVRLEPFYEKPFNEVPSTPLIYNPEESRVVLDALRYAYVYPTSKSSTNGQNSVEEREGDALAVADVLARYSPHHTDRAFYGAVVEHAGVDLAVGNAPTYDTMA
jgi:hypothetical protein